MLQITMDEKDVEKHNRTGLKSLEPKVQKTFEQNPMFKDMIDKFMKHKN